MKSNVDTNRILAWRKLYISDRNFLLIVSAVVGIISGLAAVTLKAAVHTIHDRFTSDAYDENYIQLIYPLVGLLLTIFLAKILYRDKLGHGITDILYSISKKSSFIAQSKMYSRMITSAITVGFGGSAGLESPIVLTGSAIGSNVGRYLNLNYKLRTLLIGCGTAGVISAIFNAPIAGLIFALEVILVDVTVANLVPLLISSVAATLVSILLLGDDLLFSFKLVDSFSASDTPWYILLGIICGFTAVYYSVMLKWIEHQLSRVHNSYYRALIGGVVLTLLIFICPPVYGEGYSMIIALLNGNEHELLVRSELFEQFDIGWLFLIYTIIVILVKAIASAITIGSGGSGGTFAPSMFLGGLTGFAVARLINLTGIGQISEINFILVGMCGVMCGVQYAPLTAIFLIAEITGGYILFVPLMIVSAIAFTTVYYFNPHSIYIRELVEMGEYLDKHDHDRKVLTNLKINRLIEKDFKTIHQDAMLKDLVQLISVSRRNIFPVVDDEEKLVGIVLLDDVREIMFDEKKQQSIKISKIMETPPALVEFGENMESVMRKFETTQAWNLPVLKDEKYIGFVSKSRIFNLYRQQLIEQQNYV
ncbi:chloride channel protein [Rapidithrix thailandica]|uniref:Chloride channel protein n=1 Tax=Rapidithrix thailandica TaxID=413964 RepID=A0AAW9RTB5_9BACT